jgi:adenosylhomocysteine nucleosidase
MAMPEESQGLLEKEGFPVLYTGLGKINSTYRLMLALSQLREKRPKAVINFGSAGSRVFNTRFSQRDMDVTALGFAPGQTPFDDSPATLESPKRILSLPSGHCGTGDSFETGVSKVDCNVVDMEAYAFAKICYQEKLPFLSVKYITDGADESASDDWSNHVHRAASRFIEICHSIHQPNLFF